MYRARAADGRDALNLIVQDQRDGDFDKRGERNKKIKRKYHETLPAWNTILVRMEREGYFYLLVEKLREIWRKTNCVAKGNQHWQVD